MAEVTVNELAKSIGAPVERLLKQMQEAGLHHKNAEAKVSDDEKQRLLTFLKTTLGGCLAGGGGGGAGGVGGGGS